LESAASVFKEKSGASIILNIDSTAETIFLKNQSIFCARLCAAPQDIENKAAKIDQNKAFRSGININ
jgi:hypothetical protein